MNEKTEDRTPIIHKRNQFQIDSNTNKVNHSDYLQRFCVER